MLPVIHEHSIFVEVDPCHTAIQRNFTALTDKREGLVEFIKQHKKEEIIARTIFAFCCVMLFFGMATIAAGAQ